MIIYQKPKCKFEYKLGKTCCKELFKEMGNNATFTFDVTDGTFSIRSGRLGCGHTIWVPIQFCPFCGERISILKIDKITEETLKVLKVIE